MINSSATVIATFNEIDKKVYPMKMTKKMILAALVLPLTLGAATVFAASSGGDKGPRGDGDECGMRGERGMMKELNLTAEQQTQWRAMHLAQRDQMKADREANKDVRQAFHKTEVELLLAKDFDEAAAQKLASQMVEMQTAKRVEMMHKRHDMLNILTPEQKAKFSELQMQDKMGQCQDQGPHHGKGGKGDRDSMRMGNN
jgi:periplasmic protein CpxP/Spy